MMRTMRLDGVLSEWFRFGAVSLLAVVLIVPALSHADFNPTQNVSQSSTGVDANGSSAEPSISTNNTGRFVAFDSVATNIIAGDSNDTADVFLFDRTTETTELISQSTGSVQGNGLSLQPAVNDDGTLVVFTSGSTNLVAGDSNDSFDIFLRDTGADTTTRISVSTGGVAGNSDSFSPSVSDDGAFVAFESNATNLVAGDSNSSTDIFIRDIGGGTTEIVSQSTGGAIGNAGSSSPSVSDDGQFVVFQSSATNLAAGSTFGNTHIYLRDRTGGTTTRISNNSAGSAANGNSTNPVVSDDGLFVAFQSDATNLVAGSEYGHTHVYLYDVANDTYTRLSNNTNSASSNGSSGFPAISSTGRYIAFESAATNLSSSADTNGASDIYVHDTTPGENTRVSVGETGNQANGSSFTPAINANGQFVAYMSDASNLISGDPVTNGAFNIYAVDNQCLLTLVGVTPGDEDGDATDDCADDCPEDATKIVVGECGCGVADTDTDGDGTADCNDECPVDPNKIVAGDCGCGNEDLDCDSNGQSDCLDPQNDTKPPRPYVKVRKNGRVTIVVPPANSGGVAGDMRLASGFRFKWKRKKPTPLKITKNKGSFRASARLNVEKGEKGWTFYRARVAECQGGGLTKKSVIRDFKQRK